MDSVQVLRQFNRCYTQRIGLLDESYLATGRPLGAARLLFEIGPTGAGLRELRTRLGLDSGYLSRLLRRLEADGLVEVVPDAGDGRLRTARLTAAGRREHRRLDRRSQRKAEELVAPLTVRQRAALSDALATAERLVRAATVRFETVDPTGAPARAALGAYFAELDRRFPTGFDAPTASASDAAVLRPPGGAFVVAFDDARPVGCGGLQEVDADTAEIKRMWIDDELRGLGLGRRLLAHLEQLARVRGRRRVVLDTNATLTEAIAMYERAGYRSVSRYNDNPYAQRWFAKEL